MGRDKIIGVLDDDDNRRSLVSISKRDKCGEWIMSIPKLTKERKEDHHFGY